MDMAGDEELFTAIMAKFTKLAVDAVTAMLEHLDPYIDVIVTGDDLGMTAGPMMSPASYRRLIKPYHAEFLGAIHAKSRAKVFFHSCGNIYKLLGDLADAGVDIINPVQVNCGEMGDTARLKREFGDRLTFCGGIDTQQGHAARHAGRSARGSAAADQGSGPRRRIPRRVGPLPPTRRAAGEYRGDVRGNPSCGQVSRELKARWVKRTRPPQEFLLNGGSHADHPTIQKDNSK